jgi:cell division protein FtsQ
MAQTIRRNARAVRRQGKAKPTGRQARARSGQGGSVADAMMRVLPFTEEQLHRIFLWLILAGVVALALVIAAFTGLTALVGERMSTAAGDAGFEVRRVEVRGVERMNEINVYERVLGVRDRAMPQVDLDDVRESLMELSWVADARVSRQLPDTIVVDIVEREPHAALRKDGGLALIDVTGHAIEPVSAAEAKDLLVIAGAEAETQVQGLTDLLDAALDLKEQVVEAEWIGRRRWNLTFATGQVLALPQGEERSRAALMSFARLDGTNRLLGGRVASFDMRNPDRIYLRVPGRAEEAAAAAAAAAAERKDS